MSDPEVTDWRRWRSGERRDRWDRPTGPDQARPEQEMSLPCAFLAAASLRDCSSAVVDKGKHGIPHGALVARGGGGETYEVASLLLRRRRSKTPTALT